MARKTPNQIQYEKEIKNLKRRIRYAYKEKGLIFEELPIPETPHRITKKSIEEIKSLRGEKLWELASEYNYDEDDYEYDYADYDEDDSFEDNVLKGVEERLEAFSPLDFPTQATGLWHEQYRDYLDGLLQMGIADEGRKTIAIRLENVGATYINELVDKILTDSGTGAQQRIEQSIQEFSEIIYSGAMHPISEYGY